MVLTAWNNRTYAFICAGKDINVTEDGCGGGGAHACECAYAACRKASCRVTFWGFKVRFSLCGYAMMGVVFRCGTTAATVAILANACNGLNCMTTTTTRRTMHRGDLMMVRGVEPVDGAHLGQRARKACVYGRPNVHYLCVLW